MLERNPHLGAAVVAFMYSQTRTVVKLRVTFLSFHLLLFAFMWEGARVLNVGRRVLAEHTCRNTAIAHPLWGSVVLVAVEQ